VDPRASPRVYSQTPVVVTSSFAPASNCPEVVCTVAAAAGVVWWGACARADSVCKEFTLQAVVFDRLVGVSCLRALKSPRMGSMRFRRIGSSLAALGIEIAKVVN